ncbi:MAG: hypothetical protein ACLR4Z_04385 [Butyricicoccaceae bacterium]
MGAKTGAATSGMAESSRIAVDNQYRGDLNSLSQSRLAARSAAETAAAASEASARSGYRAPRKAPPPCRRRRPCSASITPSAITACPWPV